MSKTKDIDESILDQARFLLPFVRANGHQNANVQSLFDLPWILVLVFEVLTTESIVDDMTQFDTLEQQAHVLQMILDTIDQTLKIPMNHISGIGLARLERRHLADALQIFSDLVKHCYLTPTKETSDKGGNTDQEISGISQKATVQSERQGHNQQVRSFASYSPTDTCVPERENNKTINEARNRVINSSSTFMKEIYRQPEDSELLTRNRRCDDIHEVKHVNKHDYPQLRHQSLFAAKQPTMSLCSPKKSLRKTRPVSVRRTGVVNDIEKEGNVTSPDSKRQLRYSPYDSPHNRYDLIEYPLTKRVTDQKRSRISSVAQSANEDVKANEKYNKSTSSVHRLCRKPSIKSFQSPKLSTSTRNRPYIPPEVSSAAFKPNLKTSQNKMNLVKQRYISERPSGMKTTDLIPNEKQNVTRNRSTKPAFTRFKPQPVNTSNVKKPPSCRARRTSINVKLSSGDKKSDQNSRSANAPSRRHAREFHYSIPCYNSEDNNALSPIKYQQTCNSRRRPSVVSTKARKHSVASPKFPDYAHVKSTKFSRPVNRGDVSPQTTSLCTSLKLLEEFDYVKRRLKQITVQKREYREAISELEREEVRLEYLLTHVQHQASRALNKGPQERHSKQGRPV